MAAVEPLEVGGSLAIQYIRDEDTGGLQPRKKFGWFFEPPGDGGGGVGTQAPKPNTPSSGQPTGFRFPDN
jgi:hypothetical protein